MFPPAVPTRNRRLWGAGRGLPRRGRRCRPHSLVRRSSPSGSLNQPRRCKCPRSADRRVSGSTSLALSALGRQRDRKSRCRQRPVQRTNRTPSRSPISTTAWPIADDELRPASPLRMRRISPSSPAFQELRPQPIMLLWLRGCVGARAQDIEVARIHSVDGSHSCKPHNRNKYRYQAVSSSRASYLHRAAPPWRPHPPRLRCRSRGGNFGAGHPKLF